MIIERHGRRVEIGYAKKLNLVYPCLPPTSGTAQWWYLLLVHAVPTSVPVTLVDP